jgi:hypothetical protein
MAIYNYGLPAPNYQQPMPYQQQYPQIQQTVSQTPIMNNRASGIVWVQGEAGAKAYPVAPGNSVLLMDSESDVFYIKSTDASGVPMPLRMFNYTEIVQTQTKEQNTEAQLDTSQFVTRRELEELRQMINELKPKTMSRKENRNEQTIPRNSKQQSNE